MRRNFIIITMTTACILAMATGIGDLLGRSDIICSTSACVKIHSSSFGAIFSIPVGFYASAFLFLCLGLYLKGRETLSGTILCGILGIEAYFTFLEIFFMGSLCTICLIFFGLLIMCAILARVKKNKNAMLTGFTLFFVAHFIFFYPSVTLKPTLTTEVMGNRSVEIFASPSCSHCEQAIEDLRKVCLATGTSLIIRPVSISRKDRDKSVRWISGKLFQCGSSISYRLAEKIVWENEDEAKKLNNGKLAVPLILVRVDGSREIFRGWTGQVFTSV
ncbi:MAG: hypothetical protein DRG82_15110, partial [Deltaproteobacteria bacterium]